MRLISVVMGTDSIAARNNVNQALLNYGYRFYTTHLLYKSQQTLADARVWKGAQQQLPVGLAEDLYLTVPRNQYKHLDASLELLPQLTAPIKKNQTVGTAIIKLKSDTVATRPLVALQDIAEGSLMQVLKDKALLMFE